MLHLCPQTLECMVRAHGNAAEFVPIFLIMLGACENIKVCAQCPTHQARLVYARCTLHTMVGGTRMNT